MKQRTHRQKNTRFPGCPTVWFPGSPFLKGLNEEELDLFETISDSENVSVEDEVVDELFFDKIMEEAKTVLSDLEINLIKDRVGFCRFGYVPSLKELEEKYRVSRSRIRQREIYAYEKIRKQLIAKGIENPYGGKIYTRC